MNYRQALEFVWERNCREAHPVRMQLTPDGRQSDDDPAMVMCRIKVRLGLMPDDCGSDCPLKGKAK